MSSSFQERFKNRANFVGKQGNIDIGTAYIERPKENQVFYQMIQKNEPPATAFAVPNDVTRQRFLPVEGEAKGVPLRKQTHSAKPVRNLDLKDSGKASNVFTEDFQPYSLKDYQNIKSEKYYQLGGLGPSLVGTEEWTQKKELSEKRMNYGRRVNIANSSLIQTKKNPEQVEKELSKAEKARLFAKNIPKPLKKTKTQDPPPAMNSVLEELEKQHNSYKQTIEAIKFEYKDCIN
jgi:hypothetical protein